MIQRHRQSTSSRVQTHLDKGARWDTRWQSAITIDIKDWLHPTHSCRQHEDGTIRIKKLESQSRPIIKRLNFKKSLPCKGFVKKSAIIDLVGQYSIDMLPDSTWSVTVGENSLGTNSGHELCRTPVYRVPHFDSFTFLLKLVLHLISRWYFTSFMSNQHFKRKVRIRQR